MPKILVIDDDPDIVLSVRMTMEGAGYEVVEALSGEQGVFMIQSEKPDLIILDVMMETKTEGFKLAHQLHDPESPLSAFQDIPVLMLTSIQSTTPLSAEPDIEDIPVELFVDKPIDPEGLLSKVEWLLSMEAV